MFWLKCSSILTTALFFYFLLNVVDSCLKKKSVNIDTTITHLQRTRRSLETEFDLIEPLEHDVEETTDATAVQKSLIARLAEKFRKMTYFFMTKNRGAIRKLLALLHLIGRKAVAVQTTFNNMNSLGIRLRTVASELKSDIIDPAKRIGTAYKLMAESVKESNGFKKKTVKLAKSFNHLAKLIAREGEESINNLADRLAPLKSGVACDDSLIIKETHVSFPSNVLSYIISFLPILQELVTKAKPDEIADDHFTVFRSEHDTEFSSYWADFSAVFESYLVAVPNDETNQEIRNLQYHISRKQLTLVDKFKSKIDSYIDSIEREFMIRVNNKNRLSREMNHIKLISVEAAETMKNKNDELNDKIEELINESCQNRI
ncbi:hypothetical protein SNEBB_003775 [Seison nebaliae]|nr:hypothetical protein SNEBB_003775 [Seison nebaliae]